MGRLEGVHDLLTVDARARGRVLDAGTGGGHMTRLLAAFHPAVLHSVSLDEDSFAAAKSRLGPDVGERVRFVLGDLGDGEFLAGEPYDLIAGDYLLATAARCRPFREIDLLAGLVARLAPGGLLVLTGLEPLAPCRTPEEEVVQTILRFWAGLGYLGGEELEREVPARWVVDRLRELAVRPSAPASPLARPACGSHPGAFLTVESPCFAGPVLWSMPQLRRLAADTVRRAGVRGDLRLEAFARSYLDDLCRRAARLPGFRTGERKTAWSWDWIVRATLSAAQPPPVQPSSG